MKQKITAERGVAHLLLPILLLIVLAGVAAFVVIKRTDKSDNAVAGWKSGCKSNERVSLTHLPMDLSDVATVTPYGLTAGAHVTPIDHLYLYPKGKERDAAPVYAMADGYIKEISERTQSTDSGQAKPGEFRIFMQHSCQTFTYFDLITSLDPAIKKQWQDSKFGMHIPIKAGQVIGRIGGQSLDTAVYNMDLTLPGFIHTELYDAEPWKVHTDDFFEYFVEPLQSQLLAMNQRKIKPYSGKIDYDQPGKLIGNWFLEGTNGYGGVKGEGPGKDGHGYWDGHLAIFYNALNGTSVTISVGRFGPDGQPQAFGVQGNLPDPAKVDQASGVVKYELIPEGRGISPDGKTPQAQPFSQVMGVALFQVLGGEKLRVEFFPGKTAAQVTGFTTAAKTYER